MNTKVTVWENCYDGSLKGFIVPAAFRHPAKFSYSLICRIYDYLLERQYIRKGDTCADPFGGVAIGGLVAAYRGLNWVGVELEPDFVRLANENIELHRRKLELLGKPIPQILQGDSRHFHEIINGVNASVTSPPYATISTGAGGLNTKPPKKPGQQGGRSAKSASQDTDQRYGQTVGQIARLREGQVAAVCTSPPYENQVIRKRKLGKQGFNQGATQGRHSFNEYGSTQGQIGALKGGRVDCVIEDIGVSSCICKKYAKIVEKQSTTRVDGAENVLGDKLVNGLKVSQKQKNTKEKLGKHTREFHSPCKQGQTILRGGADQNHGEVLRGVFKEKKHLKETEKHVFDVDQKNKSSFTTLKNPKKQMESGTTILKTSKRFVDHATLKNTQKEGLCSNLKINADIVESVSFQSLPSRKFVIIQNAEQDKTPKSIIGGNAKNRVKKHADFAGESTFKESENLRDSNDTVVANAHNRQECLPRKEHLPDIERGDNRATYWTEMFKVYASMFKSLKQGGVAAIVVKDYCSKGRRVRLCDDTLKLLTHLGFVPLERIHAMLVKETRERGLDGTEIVDKTERKSFFRRLHEQGMTEDDERRINWEEVLIVQKPK